MRYNYLAIEGSIGSGKTTLAKMLAKDFNARLLLERFAENPFLERFYQDAKQYAFSTEMSFLADRYQQLEQFFKPDIFQPKIISDYAYFKSLIFAQQNLDPREFALYRQFYEISFKQMPSPDLILHLNRPTAHLLKLIKHRGRTYEQEIQETYLNELKQNYLQFYKVSSQHKILILDLGEMDFVKDKEALHLIVKLLENEYPEGVSYVEMNKS